MIGLMPAAFVDVLNAMVPYMAPWSITARAFIPTAAAR